MKTIRYSKERSPLFRWMVEHHDAMLRVAQGQRIRWAPFCAKAAEHGLTDTRGQPMTERNARETWTQARRAVRAAVAAGILEAGGAEQPGSAGAAKTLVSSAHKDVVLRGSPPPLISAPKPAAQGATAPTEGDEASTRGRATIAADEKQLARQDRWLAGKISRTTED